MHLKKIEAIKRVNLILLVLLFAFSAMACAGSSDTGDEAETEAETTASSSSDEEVSVSFEAMDTYMTITVYGNNAEEAAAAAQEEVERLDILFSAENSESEIYIINENGGGTLSDESAYLVKTSLALWEATGGAFDITVYPIAMLWGFIGGDYYVPTDEELEELLAYVGSDMIGWDSSGNTITLEDGMAIGLGGIAKGYTGDRLLEIFEEYQVDGAIASLGGNIVIYGDKPSGQSWKVAIQDPEDSSNYVCVLALDDDLSIVTSGGYERYFEEDGVTYHHIIDPDTGYPADAGLISVSIISADGTEADGLSTSLFVMGTEAAIEFWQTTEDYDFEMVLVDSDGNIYISEGLVDSFSGDNTATVVYK